MSYFVTAAIGLAIGIVATMYWPVIKSWFSDESAAIASAVKAKL